PNPGPSAHESEKPRLDTQPTLPASTALSPRERTSAAQSDPFCATAGRCQGAPLGEPNGGYLLAGADERLLRTVTRFRARRRGDRGIGAVVDCLGIGYPYAHISCSGARAVTGGEHGGRLTRAGSWLLKRTLWSPPPDPGTGRHDRGLPKAP